MMLNLDTVCYADLRRGVRFALWNYAGPFNSPLATEIAAGDSTVQHFYVGNETGTNVELVNEKGAIVGTLHLASHPFYAKTTFAYLVHNGATVRDRNATHYRKTFGCLARISVSTAHLSLLISENKHYLEFYRQEPTGKWFSVYKTEVVEPDHNHYDTFLISMHTLAFDDIDRPIRIKAKVLQGKAEEVRFAGEIYTTLRKMILGHAFNLEGPYIEASDEVKDRSTPGRERPTVNTATARGEPRVVGEMKFKCHIFTPWPDLLGLARGADLNKKVVYNSKPETETSKRSLRVHLHSHRTIPSVVKPPFESMLSAGKKHIPEDVPFCAGNHD
jgi:hypothetical protein